MSEPGLELDKIFPRPRVGVIDGLSLNLSKKKPHRFARNEQAVQILLVPVCNVDLYWCRGEGLTGLANPYRFAVRCVLFYVQSSPFAINIVMVYQSYGLFVAEKNGDIKEKNVEITEHLRILWESTLRHSNIIPLKVLNFPMLSTVDWKRI